MYLLTGGGIVLMLATSRPHIAFATPAVALVPLLFGLVIVAQLALLPVKQPSMNWLGARLPAGGFHGRAYGIWFLARQPCRDGVSLDGGRH